MCLSMCWVLSLIVKCRLVSLGWVEGMIAWVMETGLMHMFGAAKGLLFVKTPVTCQHTMAKQFPTCGRCKRKTSSGQEFNRVQNPIANIGL